MAKLAFILALVSIPLFFIIIPAGIALYLAKSARPRLRAAGSPELGKANKAFVIALISAAVGAVLIIVVTVQDKADDVVYNDLKVGDCFEEPKDDELAIVNRQSCDKAHDLQVYGVAVHPAPTGAPWPGRDALLNFAVEECLTQFQSYVGAGFDETSYTDVELYPLEDGWKQKDFRRIICAAGGPAGEPLNGTIQGRGTQPAP